MLVSINGVDLTPFISEKSYKMNAESQYESWKDGNYREHRIYTASKIKGSFTVCLYGYQGIDTDAFLDIWNGGVSNHVATLLVFCQNTNKMESIEAYFTFDGTFHREMINGNYCDKLNISIQER